MQVRYCGPTVAYKANCVKSKFSDARKDNSLEGSVVAYYDGRLEEMVAAEQGGLTEGEEALLKLLNKKLRRELGKAA